MNVIKKKATELAFNMIEEGHPREEILAELTNYFEFHDQLKIELEKLKIPKDERNKWFQRIERTVQGLLIESQNLPQSEGVPTAINGSSFLKFWVQYAQHYLSASRIDVCLKRVPTLYDLVLYGKYQRLVIRGINSIDIRYILWLHLDNRNLAKRRPFQLTHNTALDKSKGMDFLDNLVKTGQFDDILFSTGTISLDRESDTLPQTTEKIGVIETSVDTSKNELIGQTEPPRVFTNNFNSIESFDELKQHFIKLTTKSNHNNQPFLTEQRLDSFIYAAFQEKNIENEIVINYGDGDIKMIISIFYEFFRSCKQIGTYPKVRKKDYVCLLSNYFSSFTHDQVSNNFKSYY